MAKTLDYAPSTSQPRSWLRACVVWILGAEATALTLFCILIFCFPDHFIGDPPATRLEEAVRLSCAVLLFPALLYNGPDRIAFPLALMGPIIWGIIAKAIVSWVGRAIRA
jgi:hypothetical protein